MYIQENAEKVSRPLRGPILVLNHISSRFLIPLSDSSLICTVPAQWLVILHTTPCPEKKKPLVF